MTIDFCKNCGSQIQTENNSDIFCEHCGINLKNSENNDIILNDFPDHKFSQIKYAGFWLRFGARLIDWIIISIYKFFMYGMLIAIESTSEQEDLISSYVYFIVILLVPFFYYPFMESSNFQATFGKMAVGIKVVNKEYKKLSPLNAIRKSLAEFFSIITFFVGYFMAGFTAKKQTLHDKIAGNYVIFKR